MAQHDRDPADKPLTGAFMELRDQAEAAVRDIITTLGGGKPGSDEARISDLYASFMDEEPPSWRV